MQDYIALMNSKQTLHTVKASTQYKREHKADYGREKIDLLYEDEDIMVIEKPCGMLSVPYPGSKARTALDAIEKIMRSKGSWSKVHRPFVVHRLDRDTSGVMVFALNESAQKKLMGNWHTTVTERLYHAVAENPKDPAKILPEHGTIDEELAQNAYHVGYVPSKQALQELPKGERPKTVKAVTHFRIIERGPTHTLFELSLDTGKKNQIRAHLSSKGYPLAGDENYRAKTDPFHRLALHARTLEFAHPVTGKKMRFEVPEDKEWIEYVKKGDPHPQKPIWQQEHAQKQGGKKGRSRSAADSAVSLANRRVSAKERAHTDFITLGKLGRGRGR